VIICHYVSCRFWTTIIILKGANEVNRQYFQQAVLLCLLKALYYAGICSYAACIILCPKLCWHNSPRPNVDHSQLCGLFLVLIFFLYCFTVQIHVKYSQMIKARWICNRIEVNIILTITSFNSIPIRNLIPSVIASTLILWVSPWIFPCSVLWLQIWIDPRKMVLMVPPSLSHYSLEDRGQDEKVGRYLVSQASPIPFCSADRFQYQHTVEMAYLGMEMKSESYVGGGGRENWLVKIAWIRTCIKPDCQTTWSAKMQAKEKKNGKINNGYCMLNAR